MTKQYAVVGDPVAHSLSPLIHNEWMIAAGLDAHYSRIHLQSDNAAEDFRAMAKVYSGLNVTLPHKAAALAAAAAVTPDARAIGAANTLVATTGGDWTAHNTDTIGFDQSFAKAMGGGNTSGSRVVLIGAGGAARAAAYVLAHGGVDFVIVNRSLANAEALAKDLAPQAEIAGLADLARLSVTADLVVNSASLGHSGGALPELAPGRGRPFLDLSYGKAAAGALGDAAARGWTPHDGLTMLVGQAAAAFKLWFGIEPDHASALAACRRAVAART